MIYSAPSYLKDLVTETGEHLLNFIQKEYGENVTAFILNKKIKHLIRNWLEEYNEYGTTIYGINTDDEKINIFNPSENGYNGLMGLNEKEDLTITKTIDFDKETDIIIAFQYSGDEKEYAQEGKSKYEEDYFDWIIIYTHNGNELNEILNIECA